VIDLHSHLLPGIDDGPETLAEAVALAKAVRSSGTTISVATPHYDSSYRTSIEDAEAASRDLREALEEEQCDLQLLVGAEISTSMLIDMTTEDLRARTLGAGACLLLESPFTDAPDDLTMKIRDLMIDGFKVLLAHPERSGYFHAKPDVLRDLVALGALCSLTAGSFNGIFGQTVRSETLRLSKLGFAHNISSDTHDLTRRPPGLTISEDVPGLESQEVRDERAANLLNI